MSDSTVNRFVGSVADAAARAAFTPAPPTPASGPAQGYTLYQRDTDVLYSWDSAAAAWVQVGGGGANVVTAAGTLTSNQLVIGGGSKAAAALGSLGTTTTVLHGNAGGAPTFGAVSLTADVSGDLPFANLAQGAALSVLGVTGNATADVASIAAGSDNQVLRRSGTAVAFGAVNLASSSAVTGTLPVANGGTGVASGFSPMLVTKTTLTNAQIKALPTTGIQVVGTCAAGSRNRVLACSLLGYFAAGAYTNVNTTYASLQIETTASQWVTVALSNDSTVTPSALTRLTSFLNTASSRQCDLPAPYDSVKGGYTQPLVQDPTQSDGLALRIAMDNNGSGDLTGGNAANSLVVVTYYVVEALT